MALRNNRHCGTAWEGLQGTTEAFDHLGDLYGEEEGFTNLVHYSVLGPHFAFPLDVLHQRLGNE